VSAPMDRLIGDDAAERFEMEALAIMEAAPLISGPTHSLALAVVALARDRQARIEIAASGNTAITVEFVKPNEAKGNTKTGGCE
jgi:hypothetical protein